MHRCDKCKETMIDGYVVEQGIEVNYYCSKDCLPSNYNELHENGQAYWTEWYEEVLEG